MIRTTPSLHEPILWNDRDAAAWKPQQDLGVVTGNATDDGPVHDACRRIGTQERSHLGCRVEFCAESSEFECPCHGSVFNRAGELLTGPSPRGLDRYPLEVATDGLVVIDTGSTISGPPPGQVTLTEAGGDGHCEVEGGH